MGRSPARLASWLLSWRPFLIGVALGLALLAAIGAATAQSIDAAPFARDLSTDSYKVESIPYDWNLNGVPARC